MIPIVFGIDQSYVLQVFVVMYSIVINSKENFHFVILTTDQKDIIRSLWEDCFRNKASRRSDF